MATFILVHGALHGGWCWQKLVPILERRGHRALAPDLPGMGDDRTPLAQVSMSTWAGSIGRLAREASERVILVGHSRGGTVISEAGELAGESVLGLVYITALLLPKGKVPFEGMLPEEASRAHELGWGTSEVSIDPATARAQFYNRSSPDDANWASARLCPEPLAPNMVAMSVTPERWGRLPRAYIECLDDQAVSIAWQRSMQAALPCDPVVTMDSDHSPFLSAPEALATHLIDIAAAFAAR